MEWWEEENAKKLALVYSLHGGTLNILEIISNKGLQKFERDGITMES